MLVAPAAALTVPSAIQYPADRATRARRFADALDVASYLSEAAVPRITIVLGPGHDAAALLKALDTLTGCADTPPTGVDDGADGGT